MSKYFRLNIFFLFMAISWEPLQKQVLDIDAAGRSLLLLSVIVFFYNIKNRFFLRSITMKPFIIWGIWFIYAFSNMMILREEFANPVYSTFSYLWRPLLVLWVINYEYQKDLNTLINSLIYTMIFCLVIILMFETSSIQRDNSVRLGDIMDPNRIGLYGVVLWSLLLYKYYKFKKKPYSLILLIVLSILPIVTIFKTGSRSVLGVFIIIIVGIFLIHRSRDFLKSAAVYLVGIIFVVLFFNFILENTYVGHRLAQTGEQAERHSLNTGTIFDKFGDRGLFYIYGAYEFVKSPVFGIGLETFRTPGGYVMHPEYMVQITELGIVGTILFLWFFGWVVKENLAVLKMKITSFDRKSIEILTLAFFGILLFGTALWFYKVPIAFTLFGLLIGNIFELKRKYSSR